MEEKHSTQKSTWFMSCLLICLLILPLLRWMWKTKKYFVDIFILFAELLRDSFTYISVIPQWGKKERGKNINKRAENVQWVIDGCARIHWSTNTMTISMPEYKMWIDINNQLACLCTSHIGKKSDPNVNKQVCGIIRTKKLFLFGKLLIFCALSVVRKFFLLVIPVSIPEYKSKKKLLRKRIYFVADDENYFISILMLTPFIISLLIRSDFDIKIFYSRELIFFLLSLKYWSHQQQQVPFLDKNVLNNYYFAMNWKNNFMCICCRWWWWFNLRAHESKRNLINFFYHPSLNCKDWINLECFLSKWHFFIIS